MANITEVLGTDLAHQGDLKRTATGDLDFISGVENVRQALFHRLITEPGSMIHRPDYGVGLKQFQNAASSLSTQRQLALRVQEQFGRDDRIEAVESVRVASTDATPEKVTIVVRVRIVGYGESELKFTPFGEGV